nr:hypothetical protein [Pontibacter sp. KCTC 32443]
MNLVLYLLTRVTNRVMQAPLILGTMLLGKTHPDGGISRSVSAKVVGTVAHYLVGILYAIGYLALWESGVGTVTLSWSLLMGFANGIFAMIIWYFFFMIHPKPPLVELNKYLIALIFGHIIFGLVLTYVFYQLSHLEYSFWQ